jgi:uncharacterized RDD family membrane protein YckC
VRFLAVFIDSVIQTVVVSMIGLVLGTGIGLTIAAVQMEESLASALAGVLGYLVGLVFGWLYEALLTSSQHQATVGKIVVGIIVTDVEGRRLSFARATGRHFAKYLSTLVLLIGYLIQPFTEKKQALHDIVAGTLVVRK